MVIYLHILNVAQWFSMTAGSKTPLDFFTAYVVVITLICGEQIKWVLVHDSACKRGGLQARHSGVACAEPAEVHPGGRPADAALWPYRRRAAVCCLCLPAFCVNLAAYARVILCLCARVPVCVSAGRCCRAWCSSSSCSRSTSGRVSGGPADGWDFTCGQGTMASE